VPTSKDVAQKLVPSLLKLDEPEDDQPSALPDIKGSNQKSYYTPRPRLMQRPSTSILDHLPVRSATDSGLELDGEASRERNLNDADWVVCPSDRKNTGLWNAVTAAYDAGTVGRKLWFGQLRMGTDAMSEQLKQQIADNLEQQHESVAVFAKDDDSHRHYDLFCKVILWPVFHYQIPDSPTSKAFLDHSFPYYVKINQLFADQIVQRYEQGDTIWIHDYHLLLVPALVRAKLPEAQIGFFLHIAFPSSEVFRCLARRKELLEGMLGANLIGFQTQEYVHHFLQTCSSILSVEALPNGLQLEDRFVDVGAFPIGLDPTSMQVRRKDPQVLHYIEALGKRFKDKKLIVARDKLNSTRGVTQKLLAFELMLRDHPELKEEIVLIQIASPTAESSELDGKVSEIVTRINSCNSALTHQPLVFLKQDIPDAQFVAMLSIADALAITSLREGMNLTSHEFIFCQDGKLNPKKYGALVLSEFT
jgi:trehalose-6-phosphate synthase